MRIKTYCDVDLCGWLKPFALVMPKSVMGGVETKCLLGNEACAKMTANNMLVTLASEVHRFYGNSQLLKTDKMKVARMQLST